MRPFLRRVTPKDDVLKAQLVKKSAELKGLMPDTVERMVNLGECGELARTLGDFYTSKRYLQEALDIARAKQDREREVANLIRLGTTFQYLDEYVEAETLLSEALEKSSAPDTFKYKDYTLQHLGKLMAEQALYNEARDCFEAAMQIRAEKADQGLIDSTQNALDFIDELIEMYQ